MFREGQQIHMGLQTLGRNRREVLPRNCSLMHRAGWIRDRVLYHEHGRTIHFTVSDVGPLLSVYDPWLDFY